MSSKSAFLIWAATSWERARPSHRQAAHHLVLQLDLLGYGKRVVYLDAEIAHRAFQLRVPEKQLHGSQVARFLVYLCRLGPSHRMRAIAELSSPALATQEWTIRAYYRVDRCGCIRTRLGKRYRVLRLRMSASHAWIAARVCSVISNCTGRPVFF